MEKDIFIITSVINTGAHPWSYCDIRSVYSSDERFSQSLETIESIRKFSGDAKILFVECSKLSENQETELRTRVDFYINIYGSDESDEACMTTNKKGYGEALQTKRAVEYILSNNITFSRLFKISGRYSLTNFFDEKEYSHEEFTFLKSPPEFPNINSTVIYSVPHYLFQKFMEILDDVLKYYRNNPPAGYEMILPVRLHPKKTLDRMGVSGLVAVDGTNFAC
jgi:hypothetical protein